MIRKWERMVPKHVMPRRFYHCFQVWLIPSDSLAYFVKGDCEVVFKLSRKVSVDWLAMSAAGKAKESQMHICNCSLGSDWKVSQVLGWQKAQSFLISTISFLLLPVWVRFVMWTVIQTHHEIMFMLLKTVAKQRQSQIFSGRNSRPVVFAIPH